MTEPLFLLRHSRVRRIKIRTVAIHPIPHCGTGTPGQADACNVTFLDQIARRACRYFWEQADPHTGLVRDRARLDRRPDNAHHRDVASIAATGFGLTGLAIAADRGWLPVQAARQRARRTLRFLLHHAPQEQGWFYHFLNLHTGRRAWQSEVSSIDTALLMAGVLTVGEAWDDRELRQLAATLYRRMNFPWMLAGDRYLLSHGWTPEKGFIPYRWNNYSEASILYFLAIGSPSFPIPAGAWYAWKRSWVNYAGFRYIAGAAPLFIHQYSQAWMDLRGRRETMGDRIDYFENSQIATRAQRMFCMRLHARFRDYGPRAWGLTASESAHGYVAWGGPPVGHHPLQPFPDGTLVPCAPAGSLMFLPRECLECLENLYQKYGRETGIWGVYGFCDAFNPLTGWRSPHVLGIDQGISLLSAANARDGMVWRWFMRQDTMQNALNRTGLNSRV